MILHIKKSALKFLHSIVALCLLLGSGCVWWVVDDTSSGSHPHYDYYEMWFQDVDVYCEYNAIEEGSYWTVVAMPESTGGYDEIDEVYVEIAGSYTYTYANSFRLTPNSYGTWSYSFYNYGSAGNSYYCGSQYDFEFIAYDDYNNYVTMWYYW